MLTCSLHEPGSSSASKGVARRSRGGISDPYRGQVRQSRLSRDNASCSTHHKLRELIHRTTPCLTSSFGWARQWVAGVSDWLCNRYNAHVIVSGWFGRLSSMTPLRSGS